MVGTSDSSAAVTHVRVWDPLVRSTHWIVAFGCLANLSFLRHIDEPHEWVGYAALAAVLVRVGWGLVAPGCANFRDFMPSPATLLSYLKLLLRGREPRYLGHNPAGAAMMVTLMVLVIVCGVSGWMLGLDAYWGDSAVEGVHVAAANTILYLTIVHVAGAVIESIRHRENLVWSMLTGYKRTDEGRHINT